MALDYRTKSAFEDCPVIAKLSTAELLEKLQDLGENEAVAALKPLSTAKPETYGFSDWWKGSTPAWQHASHAFGFVPPVGTATKPQRIFHISPSCQQAGRLQSEKLDRPLTFFESIGLRLHLVLCKWCRRHGEQIKFLRRDAPQSDQHQQQESTVELSPEARERIKQKLQPRE